MIFFSFFFFLRSLSFFFSFRGGLTTEENPRGGHKKKKKKSSSLFLKRTQVPSAVLRPRRQSNCSDRRREPRERRAHRHAKGRSRGPDGVDRRLEQVAHGPLDRGAAPGQFGGRSGVESDGDSEDCEADRKTQERRRQSPGSLEQSDEDQNERRGGPAAEEGREGDPKSPDLRRELSQGEQSAGVARVSVLRVAHRDGRRPLAESSDVGTSDGDRDGAPPVGGDPLGAPESQGGDGEGGGEEEEEGEEAEDELIVVFF